MARFFIDRPVFAWVISILIALTGIISINMLPIAQYPEIAPPSISLEASYPGASAQVAEDAVTSVVGKEMNGAPGLIYMEASSDSTGRIGMTLTFEQGTDPDLAAVEVQNRLKRVEIRLPESVRQEGIKIEKAAHSLQVMISISSDGSLDKIDLGELVSARWASEIRRVKGVGSVEAFGAERSMRIWPDPAKLEAMALTPADIVAAVQAQSARLIIGDLGGAAVDISSPINVSVVGEEALNTPEQFEDISLRTLPDGSAVRLKDVALVELGGSMYTFDSRLNGKVSTGMGVKMAPGANAVETTKLIREKMDELAKDFPPGVEYQIPMETAKFVQVSINKVVVTLLEAIFLVFVVMFLFMQNLRATLIPTLVVPIALLGTFCVLLLAGFSINMLTMFAMVLGIGILVDDAIVVVENVERIMTEEGLNPREATIKAMKQISGAIVGITAVLTSVFIPMAFFSGAVGNIYRQFSLTLVVSILFSAFLALSLTPALCATLLKPVPADHHEKGGFFGWFNRVVVRTTEKYGKTVGYIIKRPVRALFIYLLIVLGMLSLYRQLPTGFLPDEDKGNFLIIVSTAPGTLMQETQKEMSRIVDYLQKEEPVEYAFALSGFSLDGSGSNTGICFASLDDWSVRTDPRQAVQAIVERVNQKFANDPKMIVIPLNVPSIPELGVSNGFSLRLEDKIGLGRDELTKARDTLLSKAKEMSAGYTANPVFSFVRFQGMPDVPQIQVDIDRKKAHALGVPMSEINTALAVMFGSSYIGDFMYGTQVRRIIVQADPNSRTETGDIDRLHVRNNQGELVPLKSLVTTKWIMGAPRLTRYNDYPSYNIDGAAAEGMSSGEAMDAMEKIAETLPQGIGYEWTGISREEKISGAQANLLYGLSVLIIFLVLAALYESWSIPFSVILVVPLGLIGALLAVSLRDMHNDIYFKVGLIATMGLSAKNAILIVEFAKELYRQGMSLFDATVEASRLRLRPIVMTSLAFGVGVVPLAFATGAGAGAQTAIGTGVLGGITTATILAVFLVPLFFSLIGRLMKREKIMASEIH